MPWRHPRNPGARSYKPPTPAQERNWRIFRLRGLYWLLGALTGPRLQFARQLVDWELVRLGAEPETERHSRVLRDQLARWEADEAVDAALQPAEPPDADVAQVDEEIPF